MCFCYIFQPKSSVSGKSEKADGEDTVESNSSLTVNAQSQVDNDGGGKTPQDSMFDFDTFMDMQLNVSVYVVL